MMENNHRLTMGNNHWSTYTYGTKPEDAIRIYYNTVYCTKRGHKYCRISEYAMKSKTREE